jgi:Protein of unknown function (DUF2637)
VEAHDLAGGPLPNRFTGMTLRRVASLAGALVVAAIAALASYSHMRGLAVRYGQPELIADLLPVSVDGMMVVATVALGDGRRNRWSAWLWRSGPALPPGSPARSSRSWRSLVMPHHWLILASA